MAVLGLLGTTNVWLCDTWNVYISKYPYVKSDYLSLKDWSQVRATFMKYIYLCLHPMSLQLLSGEFFENACATFSANDLVKPKPCLIFTGWRKSTAWPVMHLRFPVTILYLWLTVGLYQTLETQPQDQKIQVALIFSLFWPLTISHASFPDVAGESYYLRRRSIHGVERREKKGGVFKSHSNLAL